MTLPLLGPALVGAALLTFMTSLASFSAPYIFGGGFRVMTTQIVASKLNGQIAMAQVETVTLALLAFLGLWAVRRAEPGRSAVVGGVRGIAPQRTPSRGWRSHPRKLRCYKGSWVLICFFLDFCIKVIFVLKN